MRSILSYVKPEPKQCFGLAKKNTEVFFSGIPAGFSITSKMHGISREPRKNKCFSRTRKLHGSFLWNFREIFLAQKNPQIFLLYCASQFKTREKLHCNFSKVRAASFCYCGCMMKRASATTIRKPQFLLLHIQSMTIVLLWSYNCHEIKLLLPCQPYRFFAGFFQCCANINI